MSKACLACQHIFEGDGDKCPECGSDQVMGLPDVPPEGLPKSALLIEFAAPGSALLNVRPIGSVGIQQLGVAGVSLLLDFFMSHFQHMLAAQQEEEPQIAVPGMTPQQVASILRKPKGSD